MAEPISDAWVVSDTAFPRTAGPTDQLRFLVNYAVLAPSTHNTQPWLFKVGGEKLELYADRTRSLAVADPEDRELTISCGASLFHLRIAARHFGHQEAVEPFPRQDNPDLLARFGLSAGGERLPKSICCSKPSLDVGPIACPLRPARCPKRCSVPCKLRPPRRGRGATLSRAWRSETPSPGWPLKVPGGNWRTNGIAEKLRPGCGRTGGGFGMAYPDTLRDWAA